jgi:hypothetical protein
MLPDQRGQGAEISRGEFAWPVRLGQNLLQHEGVDVHHAVLEKMQVEHADLVILSAVADHFAATGEENEVIGAVPLLDDVQTFVDLPAECLAVKVLAQEDGLHGPAKLREGLVGRMLNVAPHEAAQDRFGLGCAKTDGRHVFDQLVVLLANEFPVDRLGGTARCACPIRGRAGDLALPGLFTAWIARLDCPWSVDR